MKCRLDCVRYILYTGRANPPGSGGQSLNETSSPGGIEGLEGAAVHRRGSLMAPCPLLSRKVVGLTGATCGAPDALYGMGR